MKHERDHRDLRKPDPDNHFDPHIHTATWITLGCFTALGIALAALAYFGFWLIR